jgi:two-component system nitrogen regulation sensor histidine kinase NtrY
MHSLAACTVISLAVTWFLLSFESSFASNSGWVATLLCIDAVFLASVCYLLIKRIRKIVNFRTRRNGRKLFHKQVIMLFSCATIIPAICVFVFAILFFNIGIENLFKTPVRNVIINARDVASIYIDDVKFNMENFTNGLSEEIRSCINGPSINSTKVQEIIDSETATTKVGVAVLQSTGIGTLNIIASTPFSISLQYEDIPGEIELLERGGVIAWESVDRIISGAVISHELGIYLVAAVPIDKTILDHKHRIKTAILEYTSLATQRAGIKVSFMVVFAAITVVLLLIAILLGISFANWILRPVNKLIIATRNITLGNYNTPIRTGMLRNEWDVLIATFNDMMTRLERQRQQLIVSNKQSTWRNIARKIAHEIKNPLTPIQLSAERLKSKYAKEVVTQPEVFESCINTIVRQVGCIGRLVTEFSDLARMPNATFEDVDLTKLVKEIVFMHANANAKICFHQSYDRERLICEVDQDQINRMIVNVLQNAVNAITESTDRSCEIIGNVSLCLWEADEIVHITVDDDGPGFSDVALEKALDPYYTTRAAGTGLGLSIVHKVITDHSGEISLGRSQSLSGANIAISFPKKQLEKRRETNEVNHGI